MIYDIIIRIADYLAIKDKIIVLGLDKYLYGNLSHSLTLEENIENTVYNERNIDKYQDHHNELILHLIVKHNKVRVLEQNIKRFINTWIVERDFINTYYTKHYQLFVLLLHNQCVKKYKINNIFIDACREGLFDIVSGIVYGGFDTFEIDYLDNRALNNATNNHHHDIINLLHEELETYKYSRLRILSRMQFI